MAEGEGEIISAPESTSFVNTTSGSEREDESTSILDMLKAPKSAAQNRKRKVACFTKNSRGSSVHCIAALSEPKSYPATKIKKVSR